AEDRRLVKDRTKFYSELLERETGPTWKEANLTLQQVMGDYAGLEVRSETLLKAGLKYLRDLKTKVYKTLKSDNSHTLMRSLETLDLMDCGEVIFLAALERKETRGMHRRSDFPFTNPLLQDKFLSIWQEKSQVNMAWREKN
ncbi:MAG: FAD-dependent oxidoreductase, partial [Desulfobacteraceae bacterium]|nr:FAD-dependent oxidoreductase [Desulfobacteraceae bacterium]